MAEQFSPLSLKCKNLEVQSRELATTYDLGERSNFPWTDDFTTLDPDLKEGIESFNEHLEDPTNWQPEAWRATNRKWNGKTEYDLFFTLYNPTKDGFAWYQHLPFNLRNILVLKPWISQHSMTETIDIHASFGKFPQHFNPSSGPRLSTLGIRVDPFPLGIFVGETFQRLYTDPSRVMVGIALMDGIETFPDPETLRQRWQDQKQQIETSLLVAQQKVREFEAQLKSHNTEGRTSLDDLMAENDRLIGRLKETPIPQSFFSNQSGS